MITLLFLIAIAPSFKVSYCALEWITFSNDMTICSANLFTGLTQLSVCTINRTFGKNVAGKQVKTEVVHFNGMYLRSDIRNVTFNLKNNVK